MFHLPSLSLTMLSLSAYSFIKIILPVNNKIPNYFSVYAHMLMNRLKNVLFKIDIDTVKLLFILIVEHFI